MHRLGDEHTTLAELLQGAGYTTAAIVGSVAVDARFGFDQGFDIFHVAEDPGERRNPAKTDPKQANDLLRLLAPYLEDGRKASAEQGSLDDATRERLQSIGYLEE